MKRESLEALAARLLGDGEIRVNAFDNCTFSLHRMRRPCRVAVWLDGTEVVLVTARSLPVAYKAAAAALRVLA